MNPVAPVTRARVAIWQDYRSPPLSLSIVEFDYGDTAERVAADVFSGLAVLTRHDSQLVGRADLLEHPQHTGGAAAGHVI
jgi:hypothetical protein